MIPLGDDVRARRFPFVTLTLVGLCVLAFLLELGMGPGVAAFLRESAVVPALFAGSDQRLGPLDALLSLLAPQRARRVLLSLFLHGGWLHLLGNVLYLWVFGDDVEERLGRLRFLAFYLLCGWLAALAQVAAQPASRLPLIGASGAIAGVLGAYLALFPRARVTLLLPLGLLTQVRAVLFLPLWLALQLLSACLEGAAAGGGVAWWAHVGGFAAGLVLVLGLRPWRRRSGRR